MLPRRTCNCAEASPRVRTVLCAPCPSAAGLERVLGMVVVEAGRKNAEAWLTMRATATTTSPARAKPFRCLGMATCPGGWES